MSKEKGMEIHAWCIMTRHIHLVFRSVKNQKPELLIRDLKSLGKPIADVSSIKAISDPLKGFFPDKKLCPQIICMSVIYNWQNDKKIPLENVQE